MAITVIVTTIYSFDQQRNDVQGFTATSTKSKIFINMNKKVLQCFHDYKCSKLSRSASIKHKVYLLTYSTSIIVSIFAAIVLQCPRTK